MHGTRHSNGTKSFAWRQRLVWAWAAIALPLGALWHVIAATTAAGQMPQAVSADAGRRLSVTAADKREEPQNVLLMLDGGPVHVRLHLALAGTSLPEARRQFVTRLMETLDQDKDGKLSRDEASRSAIFRKKERPTARGFLKSLGKQTDMTRKDVELQVNAKGGGPIGYREEFTSSQNDVAVFKLLDADESGTLDTAELSAAQELIIAKDTDDDDCVSFEEFFPTPPAPTDPIAAAAQQADAPATPVATATRQVVREMTDPNLPRRLRIKYDRNRDLKLDAAELGWNAERIAELDRDGGGSLDERELTALRDATPDLELKVDLQATNAQGGVVVVERCGGKRLDDAGRPDYAKVAFSGAIVSFSMRNADPIDSAIDDAMQQFNALDADANGYLDKDETSARTRFQQGLFELIDADGDEKIFVDEMRQYARESAEPASTTCRMNLYDTGFGFFMALDANADGRISKRERNRAAHSMAALERDGQSGISQTEPVRHFHIEFVRGTRHSFGASEELVARTPAFQQRLPTGPIWFQRMDRNNDGDLIWNEFFGPLTVFHELDADHDELLDPQEAASYRVPESSTTNSSR